MKENTKKKKGIKSLYLYMSLTFLLIMLFVILGTIVYSAIKGGLSIAFAETVIKIEDKTICVF